MKPSRILMVGVALLALPLFVFAQTDASATQGTDTAATATGNPSAALALAKDGVFGCNQTGAYSLSVGALAASGGAFVPVNDAAVTLNTGYLVYKECVLRGIVDREREAATAALQKQIVKVYLTGNNGRPYFSQNLDVEGTAVYDNSIVTRDLSGNTLNTLNPAYIPSTKRAIARGYAQMRNNPTAILTCPYVNITAAINGNPTGSYWDALSATENPACSPYGAYTLSNQLVMQNAANAWNNQLTQLNWYNGNYGRQVLDENGNLITITPGSLIGDNLTQALQTGFAQLQNANDIDQMVGALFAGITSQVVGDSRGLTGLVQTTGSTPSYLDQIATQSASGLRNSALNAAITILVANQQVEQGYLAAMQGIATVLTNTINSLRDKENTCWNAVIQNVCVAGSVKSDGTCTAVPQGCTTAADGTQSCPTAITLKVATSTAFSQPLISNQITPLASSTYTNIQNSNTALGLVSQLLTAVTNTTSVDAQRVALQQLDVLVSQHKLHTQYDAQNAVQSKNEVTGSMTTLLSNTVANWTGGGSDGTANASWDGTTYPAVGWCNISNPTTIQAWITQWKK